MSRIERVEIQFPNQNQAVALRSANLDARQIIDQLALPAPRALLILNGGTASLAPDLQAKLQGVLRDGLAQVVAEEAITVITGGTDAGIFHLFGQGLAKWRRTAPCIGVAVANLVSYPGHPHGKADLEPHHSHFVLVDGEDWGDETATMYSLVATLAQDVPSLALFAGGGEICIREMQANVAQGRRMILLAGSGRSTDSVLAAADGHATDDPRLANLAREGRIYTFNLDEPLDQFVQLLRGLLS
jgi:hypothetical protein